MDLYGPVKQATLAVGGSLDVDPDTRFQILSFHKSNNEKSAEDMNISAGDSSHTKSQRAQNDIKGSVQNIF